MTARRAAVATLLVVGLWLASGRVEASTNCTVSTTPVTFGTYNVFDPTDLDSTGSVTLNCTQSSNRVFIDIGTGSSNSYAPRAMKNGIVVLNYNLYVDAARTLIWGNGNTAGTMHYLKSTPTIGSITVTVYGRVPAKQDVSAGTYSDTLVVTLDF